MAHSFNIPRLRTIGFSLWFSDALKIIWRFISTVMTFFGTLLTFVTLFCENWVNDHKYILFLLFGVIFIIVYYWMYVNSSKAKYTDENGMKVIIEKCDLLKQEGWKIIHTTSNFDTDIDTVYHRSLHGQFLEYCKNNNIDIEGAFNRSIVRNNLKKGSSGFYPLGTILELELEKASQDKETIIEDCLLVAFADYVDGKNLEVDTATYRSLLHNMWCELSNSKYKNNNSTINIAVMGNKFVRFPSEYTIEHKVEVILQEYFTVIKKLGKVCDTLRICIHPNDAESFGFYYYDRIIRHIATSPVEKVENNT